MISPKLAVLTALMAASSMGAIPALAQEVEVEVDNSRENSISQFIAQSNEACTNAAGVFASEKGKGDQEVEVEQENFCIVEQENEAEQEAEIEDESTSIITAIAAEIGDIDLGGLLG